MTRAANNGGSPSDTERDSMVFYRSFYEAAKTLGQVERVALIEAILAYQFDGEKRGLPGGAAAVFIAIKPQLDTNNRRYKNAVKGGEHGVLGGRPKKKSDANAAVMNESNIAAENPDGVIDENPEDRAAKTPNDNVNVNVNENVYVNENENAAADKPANGEGTRAPTLGEIEDYCKTENNGVDPAGFYDYYSAKGWRIGSEAMRDWKAAVRNWARRSRSAGFAASGRGNGRPEKSRGVFDTDEFFEAALKKSYGEKPP